MERRQFQRNKTMLTGKIVFNNLYSTMDCRISNSSKEGLGLRLPNTLGIPDHVRILLDRDGSMFNADIKWRKVDRLGIQIVPGALAMAPGKLMS